MGATLNVTIDFSNGSSFNPSLVLDDPSTPLGTGVFGTSASQVIDVSQYVLQCEIRRAYNRNADDFQGGSAALRLIDETGLFNPDNPNGILYGKILPMRKIRMIGEFNNVQYALASMYVQSWKYQSPTGIDPAFIDLNCVDGFQLLNLSTLGTFTGSVGQTCSQRVSTLLDAASWPSGMRDISTNSTTICQADPGTSGRSALSALLQISQTELGSFYFDEFGFANFYTRTDIVKAAGATPTQFTDSGSGIAYLAVNFDLSDTGLVNYASVTRSSGSEQLAIDTASQEKYFQHSKIRSSLLMTTDADALNQAKSIVASRKEISNSLRMESITIDAFNTAAPTQVTAALSLDVFNPIQVTQTLPGGAVTTTLLIQGVSMSITPNSWLVSFVTATPFAVGFVLDSTTQGKLNTSPALLGY